MKKITDAHPTKQCPYCPETIHANAKKCKHCGEMLDATLVHERKKGAVRVWNPGVAAVLSLVIPGAGQMYKGEVGTGMCWLLVVPLGYLFLILPGLALHIYVIFDAYNGDPNE